MAVRVAGLPGGIVLGLAVRVHRGRGEAGAVLLKLALTLIAAAMMTEQLVLVPLHAPLQPAKVLPLAGVALRVTVEPAARLAAQVPELLPAVRVQLRLPGLLLRVPEPLPVALSVSSKVSIDCPLRTRRTWLP